MELTEYSLYHYKAHVVSIYDGDTIRVNIDLGLGILHRGNTGKGVSIRLYGINTPEVRREQRAEGLISRDYLRKEILGKDVILQTIKDKTGKYGRYLGIVYYQGKNINDWLVEQGLAIKVDYS